MEMASELRGDIIGFLNFSTSNVSFDYFQELKDKITQVNVNIWLKNL